jgi:orotidine-5'-phosphate decarboxylase
MKYPDHLLILDAKRGDIGNTSDAYAKTFFDNLQSDAVTINPYMGSDSILPFLNYKDKWSIVLGLTSNEGANDFQLTGTPNNYLQVIHTVSKLATEDTLMFVIGATKSELLQEVRKIIPNHFLLIPGVGHQGGSLQEVVRFGFNHNCGLIVNSSRAIIYASNDINFSEVAMAKAEEIQKQMSQVLLTQKFI